MGSGQGRAGSCGQGAVNVAQHEPLFPAGWLLVPGGPRCLARARPPQQGVRQHEATRPHAGDTSWGTALRGQGCVWGGLGMVSEGPWLSFNVWRSWWR